ncbi:MAG: sulfatase-like hydrolase/transferase [Tepidisphaera sp.]
MTSPLVAEQQAFAQPIHRKALVIGVDGVRPDALRAANTPAIDGLIADGAASWSCLAEDITISGPCWSTVLTGVHRNKHLVTSNSFIPNALATYPHFFARLRGTGQTQGACADIRTASIAHWAPINNNILLGAADVIQSVATDDGVRDACRALLAADTTDLIFVHFDDVDYAGHASGFSPANPSYIAAIEQTDARIGIIVDAIESRPTYASEDWLILVTTDHGGSGTSHGQNIPEHRNVFMVVSGASTAAGTVIPGTITLADVAPTVLRFLGVQPDPAWGWDGVPVGLDMGSSPSEPVRCTVRRTLLSEDFESVPLGPSVNEAPAQGVWSGTPPLGWTVDDSGVPGVNNPAVGVTEWEGWAITRKDWWVSIAADQNRSQFTRGVGAVAVADPDEWDDRGTPSNLGPYNARLSTPAVSLLGVAPGSVRVRFDSSWRQEGLQRALLTARFDGGPAVTLLDWRSAAGPNFKPDATNESVSLGVPNPPGAQTMTLEFALLDAGNNWWWAIDHLVVEGACEASIASQPAPVTACDAGPASFAVAATGQGPFAYRWQWTPSNAPESWQDLVEGENGGGPGQRFIALGAASQSLTLRRAGSGDSLAAVGAVRCTIFDACGSLVSQPATLSVCPADFNCDGFLDFFDYDDYVNCFETGTCSDGTADFNGDGFVDFFDYDDFVAGFEAGC